MKQALLVSLLLFSQPSVAAEKLPITKGYWASPPSACTFLELKNRPAKSKKTTAPVDPLEQISEKSQKQAEKRGYVFQFLDPSLQWLADSECEIVDIAKKGSRYSAKRRCGEDGESDEDYYYIDEKGPTSVVITGPTGGQAKGDDEPNEFALCIAAP